MKCQLEQYSNGHTSCEANATHTVERFPKAEEQLPVSARTLEEFKLCDEHADDAVKGGHIHVHADTPFVVTRTAGAR